MLTLRKIIFLGVEEQNTIFLDSELHSENFWILNSVLESKIHFKMDFIGSLRFQNFTVIEKCFQNVLK